MDQTFLQIKNAVAQWAYNIKKACPNVATNVLLDTDEAFRVVFENEKRMAELLVECGAFAPYRYVKMEIFSLISKHPVPVYVWYDSQNDNIETIISNLQIGLDLMNP